jgi:hypothetical protein
VFDLMIDIWGLTEETVNAEPGDDEALLYSDVPAAFLRLSGSSRYAAAGAGVGLSHRMAIEAKTGVTERCRVKNVRTREGLSVPAQPVHYNVRYVSWGRRGHHLELDLEAIL